MEERSSAQDNNTLPCDTMFSLRGLWPTAVRWPAPQVRRFCSGPDEEMKARVLDFLRVSSRPIQGKAKAKQSAGQRAIDLTKHASKLEDLDLNGLLQADGREVRTIQMPLSASVAPTTASNPSHLFFHVLSLLFWQLAKRGVPCQDRKRLMRFTSKYVQGWRHNGKEGNRPWKGWRPPYRTAGHPSPAQGKQPYQQDPEENLRGLP